MTQKIIYEQPLNERIRTFLRLEFLFAQASHHLHESSLWDSRCTLNSTLDILSIFGIRGRSKEVYRLDDALRAAGLVPKQVPDSVKLTTLKLLKEAEGGILADRDASGARAAPMLAYFVLGRAEFRDGRMGHRRHAH